MGTRESRKVIELYFLAADQAWSDFSWSSWILVVIIVVVASRTQIVFGLKLGAALIINDCILIRLRGLGLFGKVALFVEL